MSPLSCIWRAFLFTIVLWVLPGDLAGQSWSIDTYAGRASYNIAPISVASRTGVLGIRFNRDRRLFQASVGVPFSNRDVTWGVVELGDRFALRRKGLVAGADVSLLTHGQRDPVAKTSGQGLLAEFFPMVSHNVGAGVLELRSGPRWYAARLGSADWTRNLWTSELRGSIEPTAGLQLESDVRHDRGGQGESYTRAGLSVGWMLGRSAIRGSLGNWFNSPGDGHAEWGLSIGIPIKPSVWISSAAQHESFDPTFLSPARTSWSVGLSFQIGSKRESASRASEIRERAPVVVRIPLREAGAAPYIAGDFTNWVPVRMARYENEWRLPVSLPPGVYHFAFCSEDGQWFVPPNIPNRADDGMGGWLAVLVVP